MQINIHSGASASISQQIRAQVSAAIAARELRSGDLLTPPAELAGQLVASPAAVLKAYQGLESDGLCRHAEHGFEVAPATLEQQRERARRHQVVSSRQSLLEELELARRIQKRLMPSPLVEVEGFSVAARLHAAEFVSGDFYDVLERGDGVVDVVVADVSGKGVGASLIMAFVKARLPMLPPDLPVAEVLRELNAQLHGDLGPRQFVALAYARLHGRSGGDSGDHGRVEVANAGLPYPHLLRPGAPPEVVIGRGPSLPLGVRGEVDYVSIDASFRPGDRLMLCSDGIPEARTAQGEPLGYGVLLRLLEAYDARSAGRSSTELGSDPRRGGQERSGLQRGGQERGRVPWAGRQSDVQRPSLLDWLDGFLGLVAAHTDGSLSDDQTALVVERRDD